MSAFLHLSLNVGVLDARYNQSIGQVVLDFGTGDVVAVHLDGPTARRLAARLDSAADAAAMARIAAGQDQFADAGKTSQVPDGGGTG